MAKHKIKYVEAVDSLMKLSDIYRDARSSWAGELREQLAIRIDTVIEEETRKAVQQADAVQAEFIGPERPADAVVRDDAEDDEDDEGEDEGDEAHRTITTTDSTVGQKER